MTSLELSDDDLMRRLQRSTGPPREEAFRELVRRHARGLRGFVAPIAGDRADDLVQETFLRVYQHRDRYRAGPASFRSWAYRIARNLALNSKRKEGRVRPLEDAGAEPAARGRGPAESFERALERAEVRDAVATLPERDREVVSLRFQRGLSYAEIAKVTGATPAAVKQRAWRALRRLRDVLEPQ